MRMAGEGAELPSAKLFHQALSEERRLIWRITAAAGEVGCTFSRMGGTRGGIGGGRRGEGLSPQPSTPGARTFNCKCIDGRLSPSLVGQVLAPLI